MWNCCCEPRFMPEYVIDWNRPFWENFHNPYETMFWIMVFLFIVWFTNPDHV